MPRTRVPYAAEFLHQMVELVRAGRTPEELSREFEPTAQTIHPPRASIATGTTASWLRTPNSVPPSRASAGP